MKKIIIAAILMIFSVTSWAESKIKSVDIKTKINCDHCKICESCSQRLEKALYDIKGVKRVDVDDKKMIIKVAYNTGKTTITTIKNTIAANGYDADDVKAPAEAFAKLDQCCKGEE